MTATGLGTTAEMNKPYRPPGDKSFGSKDDHSSVLSEDVNDDLKLNKYRGYDVVGRCNGVSGISKPEITKGNNDKMQILMFRWVEVSGGVDKRNRKQR